MTCCIASVGVFLFFTGAEDKKTPAEAAIYGGIPGVAYDPCYHQACDSLDPIGDGADAQTYTDLNAAYDGALEVDSKISNLNAQALDEMSDAVAHGTVTFAQTTSAVQGTGKGKAFGQSEALHQGSHLRK